ncbi:sensor histidine kinase [Neptunicoccus cionae]|uniref:C4-dicarboxylate transport sensor protein DctB n=1 Tax=Neptunicoccus cionae TaxID=2035344 RepID=A0A916QXU7_9RHOB|nr:ATP-binding protein [Amylibacter cionae]GGA16766.1 two-component sensor histidine kinase [Amylibacter cionae]
MRRLFPVLAFCVVAVLVAAGVFTLAYRANLNQLSRTGAVQLDQASDRVLAQLARFQQLPNLLARHPVVVGVLTGETDPARAHDFLETTALTVGAEEILVLDQAGRVLAASDLEENGARVGDDLGQTAHVRRALTGGLGVDHAFEPKDGGRDFFFARGIINGTAPPSGVVVVRADVEQLEFEWEVDETVVAFLDAYNVVFLSNRVELVLRRDGQGEFPPSAARIYPRSVVHPFYDYKENNWFGHRLQRFGTTGVMPEQAMVLSEFLPRLDLTTRVYLNVKDAAQNARVLGYLALAIMGLIGAGLIALGQRRRRLAERLVVEAAANARLEARVEERTAQLRQAQDQLVQAGKLTALGQMSAGISHEVNQPLAAIRNFAANGIKLIERDRVPEAQDNLDQITVQVDRINRIIKNLRGFARNESEPVEPVDLVAVVQDALRLAERRLRDEGITVALDLPEHPVMVSGGPVRLQQVIVNLMGNAMDAMRDQPKKHLSLKIDPDDGSDRVRLKVADSGTGLKEPDRVFEPFYTTKDVGASKGLGLGLSISYGIVGTFGGELSCRNRPEGGAEFCVELKKAEGAG